MHTPVNNIILQITLVTPSSKRCTAMASGGSGPECGIVCVQQERWRQAEELGAALAPAVGLASHPGPGRTCSPCATSLAPALSAALCRGQEAGVRCPAAVHDTALVLHLRHAHGIGSYTYLAPRAAKRSKSLKPLPSVLSLKPPVRQSSHSRRNPCQTCADKYSSDLQV